MRGRFVALRRWPRPRRRGRVHLQRSLNGCCVRCNRHGSARRVRPVHRLLALAVATGPQHRAGPGEPRRPEALGTSQPRVRSTTDPSPSQCSPAYASRRWTAVCTSAGMLSEVSVSPSPSTSTSRWWSRTVSTASAMPSGETDSRSVSSAWRFPPGSGGSSPAAVSAAQNGCVSAASWNALFDPRALRAPSPTMASAIVTCCSSTLPADAGAQWRCCAGLP